MSADHYVPDQTYHHDGDVYWAGQPMPLDVAADLGLVDAPDEEADETEEQQDETQEEEGKTEGEESETQEEEGETESSEEEEGETELPPTFPFVDQLNAAGYETAESVLEAEESDLADEVEDVGPSRAEDVRTAAQGLITQS